MEEASRVDYQIVIPANALPQPKAVQAEISSFCLGPRVSGEATDEIPAFAGMTSKSKRNV
jgi:hypothetical protein